MGEGKYGKITTERGSIPDGEPVFLIRARDKHSLPALAAYLRTCERDADVLDSHIGGVEKAIRSFEQFQRDHATKTPDTKPGEYGPV